MLQKMNQILIIGPKKEYQSIISELYSAGSIHLEDAREGLASPLSVMPLELYKTDQLTDLLLRVRGLTQVLEPVETGSLFQKAKKGKFTDLTYDELVEVATDTCTQLEADVRRLEERKSTLEASHTTLTRYEKILKKISPLEEQLPRLEGFEVTILIIQKEFESILDTIRPFLSEITRNQFEFVSADLDEKNIAVITVFSKKYENKVHDFLYSKNVNEVRIPNEYTNMPLYEALYLIEEDKKKFLTELNEIREKIRLLSEGWYDNLVELRDLLTDRLEEISEYSRFGQTEYTFIVKGWIPKKYIKRTTRMLQEKFGNRVSFNILPDEPDMYDKAPVFFDNPFWAKPFEFFMQLVRPPSYREIDPTPFFAIFFPLFFGFIVGDMGYAIVILLFSLFLRYKYRDIMWLYQLGGVLLISSIPTLIFGYLYGEFFGDFGEHMGWLHPVTMFGVYWHRIDALIPLLLLTFGIGVFHVYLGLCMGIYNAARFKEKKHIIEKVGMLGAITGLILLLGSYMGHIPESVILLIIALIIISIIFLFYGGGAMGVMEVMGTIGNIMSYARLMAIGLASVMLAFVANRLSEEIGIVVVGLIVAIMLHALNIVLAMFSPSIHSMRLHVVEFFSKFYKGGGIPYKPFGRERS